ALPTSTGRPQLVQADTSGDAGQPGSGVPDLRTFLDAHPVPPHIRLLHRVFGIGDRAEQTIGESEQSAAFGVDHLEIIHRLHPGPTPRPPVPLFGCRLTFPWPASSKEEKDE